MAELFRSSVRFYGKHGLYLEALTPDPEKAKDESLPDIQREKYLFRTVVDVYTIAPLIGFYFHRKSERDGTKVTKTIMDQQIFSKKYYNRLLFTYRLIMILDKDSEPDLDTRLRKAFQASDDMAKKGIALFDSYARGGIEVLYTSLIQNVGTSEDLLYKLSDFVDDFYRQYLVELSDEEVDLASLLF